MTQPVCTGPECAKTPVAKGLCTGHYAQARKGLPLTVLRPRSKSPVVRDEEGRKLCGRCRTWQQTAEFYPESHRPDGLSAICRSCKTHYMLRTRYNLSSTQYEAILTAQGGGCAICGTTEPGQRAFHVDHDHDCCPGNRSCGRCVRGLLCVGCNAGVGKAGEDPQTLTRMSTYLTGASAPAPTPVPEERLAAMRAYCSTPRRRAAMRRYGLSPEQYLQMFLDQGGRCATCHQDPGGLIWHVDHDHTCCPTKCSCCGDCVRGLLCEGCNTGLGFFKDSAVSMSAAIAYLAENGTMVREVLTALAEDRQDGSRCSGPQCEREGEVHGMCLGHYGQWRKGRNLTTLRSWSPRTARDEQGRKHCPSCAQWLAEDCFGLQRTGPDGLAANCNQCRAEKAMLRRYHLTPQLYAAMLESQGGRCAACGSTDSGKSSWHVDHDHACCPGRNTCGTCVRGLLCSRCNIGLGNVSDSVETLNRMADYLLGTVEPHGDTADEATAAALRQATTERHRRAHIRRYGVDVDRYVELFVAQGGRCATCRTDDPGKLTWSVDHDHSCCPSGVSCGDCVRGLLCRACNAALGLFQDDPAVISAALTYLAAGRPQLPVGRPSGDLVPA